MVTIYDVAKKAEVSIATVSYVISNRKKVKKATRERVLNAIKELGYIPSNIAQSLNTRKTKTIGFIVPHIHSPSLSEIVSSAEKSASKYGYFLYLCNSENDINIEMSFITDLKKKWADGILIITENKKVIEILESSDIPFLVVDREFDSKTFNTIIIDFAEASYRAVEYLIKTGCRKITIINGPETIQPSIKKYEGYKKALDENNLFDEDLVFFSKDSISDFTYDIGAKITKQIIKKKLKTDAIFCSNDLIAIGTINTLFEHNIKIPEEISVVSADESYLTKFFEPRLTKIRFPYTKLGKEAVKLLYKKINTKKGKEFQSKTILPGNIIIGETTREIAD